VIFDTNVLIYLSKYILKPEAIINRYTAISVVTKIEALGYSFKNVEEYMLLSAICDALEVVPLSDEIANETINLRKKYRIKLPDAIIYSTALVKGLPLLTNNIADFKSLDGKVNIINPFNL
jgi:predicted nucleic acid-binding protein